MMNLVRVRKLFVRGVMKLAGITPEKVEIEPGTTVNFWVPTEIIKKTENPNQTMNRPSVVLLHGFFADGILSWPFQVLALAGKYDVYVPDLLFFGDSTIDKPDRSISFQVECLAKGLRKLGVERCIIFGFSYGGIVGLKLAKLQPELVESMIMSGTTMKLTEGMSRSVNMMLPETIERLKLLISIGSHNKLFASFPNFIYRDILEFMYSNRKERAELLKALVDDEHTPAKYSQKFYLLRGAYDTIVNLEVADQLKRQLGDKATFGYIEKAGHMAQWDRPIMYNQHLKKILVSFTYKL